VREVDANGAAPRGQWHDWYTDRLHVLFIKVRMPEFVAQSPELIASDVMLEVQTLHLLWKCWHTNDLQ
jgi:hypothetical protein